MEKMQRASGRVGGEWHENNLGKVNLPVGIWHLAKCRTGHTGGGDGSHLRGTGRKSKGGTERGKNMNKAGWRQEE